MIPRIAPFALGTLLGLNIGLPVAWADSGSLVQTPLFVTESVPPLNMLVMGRDHSLYAPAYDNTSDLDGDGVIDVGYKGHLPANRGGLDYFGYFDSKKCYQYSSNIFVPQSVTTDKTCAGDLWSGDYLNYLTTSRMDALRKVLYGGYRSTETAAPGNNASRTILERVYIRRDAHTWGSEYENTATNGYDIRDYTPYTSGTRLLFASTSLTTTGAPMLRVARAQTGANRIWDWVAAEVTQARDLNNPKTDDYVVRVEVCKEGLLEDNCKRYNGKNYRPTGLLHDFGESDTMYFGLLTGSYTNNLQGGVLRKALSSFQDEVNSTTGQFVSATNGIVKTLNTLKIDDPKSTGAYNNCDTGNTLANGKCRNWGNPLAEMMFETLRYLSGASAPTSSYSYSGSNDVNLALPKVSNWTNPYADDGLGKRCSRPFMTVISDVNPNYDSSLPGNAFGETAPATTTALAGIDVSARGQAIWDTEIGGTQNINIGQVGTTTTDYAPTAKSASSFGNIRGLPDEPTKGGTYYSASVAYYANTNPITTKGNQPVKTYAVALSSPLPQIRMPLRGGDITLVPFGKVVTGNPDVTMQITGFFVDSMNNMPGQDQVLAVNGGRPQARFRVVFDDAAQGADYDVDVTVQYDVRVTDDNRVEVILTRTYANAGHQSHIGYTLAGAGNDDGIYLEVSGGNSNNYQKYRLDTHPGQRPGACNPTTKATCSGSLVRTDGTATQARYFSPGTGSTTNLENPLWYAAKWGGFGGFNNASDSVPEDGKWDSETAGTPDNYFLVTNASTLREQLTKAFNAISGGNTSVTSPTISTQDSSTVEGTFAYTTSFDVDPWRGTLRKVNTTTPSSTPGQGAGEWTVNSTPTNVGGRKIIFARNRTLASFTWNNLNEAQKALLNTASNGTVDSRGEERVNTIRGSRLGDIINSSPLLVSGANYSISKANALEGSNNYNTYRSGQANHSTIYVGANDGMLHAFDATTGAERFAFIPSAVIENLPILTAEDYGQEGGTPHKYFVDGSPIARDVYFKNEWHKVLLGSLGAGGRSVFALDVTDPNNPKLLWEFSNEDDPDMGYSVPTPGIFRLHTGEWAALVPNGYDSGSNSAVLFVLNIETGEVIQKLTATPDLAENESVDSLANGLSRVMGFDINNDGIVDYAYAGDLLGNLWRFDLIDTSSNTPFAPTEQGIAANKLQVSFGGAPLYVARNNDGERQPITAAPLLTRHPTGLGYIVTFGTGRYLTTLDKTATDPQSLYGIWDRNTAGQAISSSDTAGKDRDDLLEQTFTSTTFNGNRAYTLSQEAVSWYNNDGNVEDWGWYFDFPVDGERLIYNMRMLGNTQLLATITPNDDPCEAGLTGTAYGINSTTGGATLYATFDLDGDGEYDPGISGFVFDGGDFSISSGSIYVNDGGPGGVEDYAVNAGLTEGRQTWRQLPTEE
ncbi:PilC/PilY family type IV pilus protein [Pseudomonas sediminis]|uniref:pilus assembly protein n=1 Tax=Pseudomonas sediminis TaxID=1691904 RepID=UPI00244CB86B|nr:PilC/PilY family type IV pilus protein [Pseudomonas sediminis]MDG9756528.1 PilC/PilY family type IV pilus protein [Pseudomonas sediminis]